MNDSDPSSQTARPRRPAWNKGKLTGPKPPLRLGHVWSIRAKLQLERRTRDLAMFNLAIDSKLRLRPRGAPCGRRGTQRLRGRQSNYPPTPEPRPLVAIERLSGSVSEIC